MSNNYEIRLYDELLLAFELSIGEQGGYAARILTVGEQKDLFPLDLELTDEGILKWLHRRIIPKNRAYSHNILNTVGLSLRNIKGIIDICNGLSLNDSYWVVPAGLDGLFADYNLYANRFSEVLAITALTGESPGEDKIKHIHTSPEFTTTGMLPKAWRYSKNRIILFKGGAFRQYATTPDPLEPYSEYYAAQIADIMGLRPVLYGLSKWKGIFGSTCELFTDINTAYVPMSGLIGNRIKDIEPSRIYSFCGEWFKTHDRENGTDLFSYFCSILVFDSLILNEDRHLNNFGLLRNNHTGKIIGSAPIFDNGISLFNYSSIQELHKIDIHSKAYVNYFNQSFDSQVKEFGDNLQIEQLSRLSNFKFKKHNHYNWDSERMILIQDFIRKRAIELIEIINSR